MPQLPPSTEKQRRDGLCWAGLTALVLVLGAPILAGGALYYGDITVQFMPWRTVVAEGLRAGRLPLWDDALFGGATLVGNPQAAMFYPWHWLAAAFSPALALGLGYLLHLWLGLAGGWLLGRELGWRRSTAFAWACIYGLNGALVVRHQFPSLAYTIAWLPWLLWAAARLWRRPSPGRGLAWAGLVALQWLAGHAQMSLLMLAIVGVWCLTRRANGPMVPRWGWLLGGGALGGLLAAVQLLPTAQEVLLSERTSYELADVARFFLTAPALALGLQPRALGAPDALCGWLGRGPYWEALWYSGLATWPLALGALGQRGAWRWALLGGLGLVLALGPLTVVYPVLLIVCPPLKLFRDPARFTYVTIIALAFLAARGLERPAPAARGWAWGLAAASLAAAIVALLLTPAAWQAALEPLAVAKGGEVPADPRPLLRAWRGEMVGGWLVAAAGLALVALLLSRPRRWTRAVLVGLLAVDLVWRALPLNPIAPRADFAGDARPAQLAAARGPVLFMGTAVQSYDRWFPQSWQPPVDLRGARAAALPNSTQGTGTRLVHGYDPLAPADVMGWVEEVWTWPAAQREAVLAPLGVAGEWDAERYRPYRAAAPETRMVGLDGALYGPPVVVAPTPARRVYDLPAGAALTIETLHRAAPGWRAAGARLAPGAVPVQARLEVAAADTPRRVRTWYAPTAYRLGLFLTLLALGGVAAGLAPRPRRRLA